MTFPPDLSSCPVLAVGRGETEKIMTIKTLCLCGREATTEVQSGWDPTANCGAGGGVYEPLCEECYAGRLETYAELVARHKATK